MAIENSVGTHILTDPAKPAKKARQIDLTAIPNVSFAWIDERTYAAIRGCSVKVVQRERSEGIGCPYRKINSKSIRYRLGDVHDFLNSQPSGGGALQPQTTKRGPGRPRNHVGVESARQ